MQKNSTAYMFVFALIITLGCGVLLAMVSESTKEARKTNVKVEKMTNILSTVDYNFPENATNADVEEAYNKLISEVVVDKDGNILEGIRAFDVNMKAEKTAANSDPDYNKKLPVFIYTQPETEDKYYVMPMRGNGLWGAVWGYISLASDFETVFGVKFDHESETPGLGAEITTDWFQEQFEQKKAFDEDNDVALTVLKGEGNELDKYSVDGMAGATITGNGVDAMIKNDLSLYTSYFKKKKSS